MKAPSSQQHNGDHGTDEPTYKVTLHKEIYGPPDEETGERELLESVNLLELETVELSELKGIIRNRGIHSPSSSSAQAGISFFSSSADENAGHFERDEATYYQLWLYEKNDRPLSTLQLAREARELGLPFSDESVEEKTLTLIQEKFARTLFVSALADQAERLGYPGLPGADWFDLAPAETPAAAHRAAGYLIRRLEMDNECDVVTLFRRALGANQDLARNKALDDFCFYVPMTSAGAGLSWTDNHEPFQIGYPFYFSPDDLIIIGRSDFSQLPSFEAHDIDEELWMDTPAATSWGFRDDYEPPLEPRTPVYFDGPSA